MAIISRPVGAGGGDIVSRPAKTSVWRKMGIELTPEQQAAHPYMAAGAKTAQEMFTIPYHFFNQLLANYPRYLLEKGGMYVPEAESKVAQAGAKGFGVAGGILSPLNKLAVTKVFKGAPLAQKALTGGLAAGLYASDLEQKPLQVGAGALLGAGIPLAGAGIKKVGTTVPGVSRWVSRNVGQVEDFTVNTIKRLSAKRVFSPRYASATFIGDDFVPRVQEKFFNEFSALKPQSKTRLVAAGFKPAEADDLIKIGQNARKQFVTLTKGGMLAEDAAQAVADNAKAQYRLIFNKTGGNVNISKTVTKIRSELVRNRWIDPKTGQVRTLTGMPNTTRDNLLRAYNELNLRTNPRINPRTKVVSQLIDGDDYLMLLDEFERMLTGDPRMDRTTLSVIEQLKNDAVSPRTGIVGLKIASKSYSDAMLLKKYAPKLSRVSDPARLEAKFGRINAGNVVKKVQQLRLDRAILGDELADDLAAHYAAINFDPNFYPSRSGVTRQIVRGASKEYYKRLDPQLNAIRERLSAIQRGLSRGAEAYADYPYFSPATRLRAEQLLRSKRGSVLLPGGGAAGRRPF